MKLFGRSASSHNVKNAPNPPASRPESLRNLAPTNSDNTFDPARYSQQVTGKPEPAAPSNRFSETYRAAGPPPLPGTLPPRSELEQRLKDFYLEHDPAKAGDMEKIIVATQRNGLHWLKDGLMRKYNVTIDFDKPLLQQQASMGRSQSVYQPPTTQPPLPPPARSQSVYQQPSTTTAVVQPPPLPQQHSARSQSVYQAPPPLPPSVREDDEAQKRAAMRRKQEEEEMVDRQRNKYSSLVQKDPVQIQQRKVDLAKEELERLLNQVEVAKEELEREKRVLEQLLGTQQQQRKREEDDDHTLQQQREAEEQQRREREAEEQQRRERERLQQLEAEEREEEQRCERDRLRREEREAQAERERLHQREAEEQQRRREQKITESRTVSSPPPLPVARNIEAPSPPVARNIEVVETPPPAPLARPESMRMFIPMGGVGGGGGLEAKARALEAQSRALAKQAQEEEDARLEREAAKGAAAQPVEDEDDDKAEEDNNFAHQVLLTRKPASATQGASALPAPSATPCDNFTLNMAASTFGSCYCGHPKSQHQRAQPAATTSTNMFKDMSKAAGVVKRNSDLSTAVPPEVPSRRSSDLAVEERKPPKPEVPSRRGSDLEERKPPPKPEFSDPEQNRARLVAFYQTYNPEKIGEIDAILEKFRGKEANLFKKLQEKYPGSTI